jgi:type 1 glutamine amidotransferase
MRVSPRALSFAALSVALEGCSGTSSTADGGSAARDEAGAAHEDASEAPRSGPLEVQVFTRTLGFRHTSIGAGLALFEEFARRGEIALRATEDGADLVRGLAEVEVVVFLSTTGDVLDGAQQDALESFVRAGGGFVGLHSATDTEYEWPFYAELLGARFESHPAVQSARIVVEAADHPATDFLPAIWERADEWYDFDRNPRASGVTVLLRLDETSYEGGKDGADHPIAWSRAVGRGRSFYTALGHTEESWGEPLFVQHVEGALRWAAGR